MNDGPYTAAKHGVVGLTKVFALELAEHDINVNAVCPTSTATPMVANVVEEYGEESFEKMIEFGGPMNVLDLEDPAMESRYQSEAFMWLSSEASKYVTGIALPVDGGTRRNNNRSTDSVPHHTSAFSKINI